MCDTCACCFVLPRDHGLVDRRNTDSLERHRHSFHALHPTPVQSRSLKALQNIAAKCQQIRCADCFQIANLKILIISNHFFAVCLLSEDLQNG